MSSTARVPWERVANAEGMDACHVENELFVRFAGGSSYRFEGVPRTFYTKMIAAADPRRNFRAHIMGRFNYERLEA